MMFKDDRLKTDPELIELRKQYSEMGERMPGWNWDEYNNFSHYKKCMREKLEQLKKKST